MGRPVNEATSARNSASPSPKSLRHLFRDAGFLFSGLAVVAVVALLAATTYMHRVTHELSVTVESLGVAEEIQAQLLVHEHAKTLEVLAGSEAHAREAIAAAERVHELVSQAYGHASEEEKGQVLDQLQAAIRLYLAETSPLHYSPMTGRDSARFLALAFDKAFTQSQAVVQFHLDQARRERRHANIERAVGATAMGISAAILALVLVLGRALHNALFVPLERVSEAIRGYAHDRSRRAPSLGSAELRDIASSFNGLATELRSQRDNQMRFLGGVAHDLRSPLSALKNACALLGPERALPEEPKLRHLLLICARSVDRLSHMIEDLLDISRVELGRLPIVRENCDLRDIARDTVALFEPPGQSVEVSVPEEPVTVCCDRNRVHQVLNNLVSNAIKYSPEGSVTRVVARTTERGGILEVTDTGIGIPPEELTSIFQPFRRSSFTKDAIPGVGLGLFTSKQIIEAHGGELAVESSPGRGSVFRVTLPWAAASLPGSHQSPPSRNDAGVTA
jgi:signal transduction histidine kinase